MASNNFIHVRTDSNPSINFGNNSSLADSTQKTSSTTIIRKGIRDSKPLVEDNEIILGLRNDLASERQKYRELSKQNIVLTEQLEDKELRISELLLRIKNLESYYEEYTVTSTDWEHKYNTMIINYEAKIQDMQHQINSLRTRPAEIVKKQTILLFSISNIIFSMFF